VAQNPTVELPFQPPGQAMTVVGNELIVAQVGIEPRNGQVSIDDNRGLVIGMQVRAGDGLVALPDASGRIKMHRNMTITVTGNGFEPRSLVNVTLQPLNQTLGNVMTDADGAFDADLPLPPDIGLGEYNVNMGGVDQDGEIRELAVGIALVDDSEELNVMRPSQELTMSGINPLGLILLLAMGMIWWVFFGRRRTKDHKPFVDVFHLAHR